MALIKSDTKLCTLLVNDPSIITVLSRFGIELGVGDKTIGRACEERAIDTPFFITILNTYVNEDYSPDNTLEKCDVGEIIQYLEKTNRYYEQFLLPNIERHLGFLVSKCGASNTGIRLIQNFFHELKQQLIARLKADHDVWFPMVLGLVGEHTPSSSQCSVCEATDDTIADKVDDLMNMFVMHLPRGCDANLVHAVLMAIAALKKDICQNNRIREKLLRPIHVALVETK